MPAAAEDRMEEEEEEAREAPEKMQTAIPAEPEATAGNRPKMARHGWRTLPARRSFRVAAGELRALITWGRGTDPVRTMATGDRGIIVGARR